MCISQILKGLTKIKIILRFPCIIKPTDIFIINSKASLVFRNNQVKELIPNRKITIQRKLD